MSRQAERKLMLERAFKKWWLSINSYEMLEDFVWRRSTYDYLLGPLLVTDPMFEMEPEDTQDGSPQTTLSFTGDEIQDKYKTQKDDGHTPVSDDDCRTMCASSCSGLAVD